MRDSVIHIQMCAPAVACPLCSYFAKRKVVSKRLNSRDFSLGADESLVSCGDRDPAKGHGANTLRVGAVQRVGIGV